MRLLAVEHRLDGVDVGGHPRLATDEDHLVDVAGLQAAVLEGRLDGLAGLLDEVADEVLELGPGESHHEVLRARRVGRDVRQVDLGRGGRAQLDLRLLGRLLEPLQGLGVLREVDPLVLLELREQPLDHPLVEVVAAEVRVAVGRLDLEDAFAQLEDRDVEGAAAQVVDRDLLVVLLVEAVGKGRRRRLVDDPADFEAGDPTGILRRLALGVVEIRRDRDHGLGDLLAQVGLGVRLELLEDHRADLRRGVGLVEHLDHHAVALRILLDGVADELLCPLRLRVVPATAHEPLDRIDRVGRVRHGLALGELADETLARLRERDDRRDGPAPFGGGDDGRLAAFHDGDDAIRRAEIDTDDLAHLLGVSWSCGLVSGGLVVDQLIGRWARSGPGSVARWAGSPVSGVAGSLPPPSGAAATATRAGRRTRSRSL